MDLAPKWEKQPSQYSVIKEECKFRLLNLDQQLCRSDPEKVPDRNQSDRKGLKRAGGGDGLGKMAPPTKRKDRSDEKSKDRSKESSEKEHSRESEETQCLKWEQQHQVSIQLNL
ncbi:hypothetical protein H671_6g16447 [Cricetulus griseus]|nr:hypothetical protein H671_6g16447 [Cricetulus griseus]